MGRNITNNFFDIDDLANLKTGLISFIAVSEMEPADPDVFVIASETADTKKLGLPIKITSSGSGAGLTYKEALYSTIGEGLERYALGVIHPEDLIFGSYNSLKDKHKIIPPKVWSLFNEHQKELPFDVFDDNTEIAWVVADCLIEKKEFLVPACLSYIPYYKHFGQKEKIIAAAVSTGAACGNSLEETIYKGICELIERDAFLIMWRNKLRLPRIIIDSESSIYDIYKEKFERYGLEYILVDTTLDLHIPSVFGILINKIGNHTSFVVGGSANPDPEKAVIKTLTELVQGLKWADYTKSEEFPILEDYKNVRSFEDRMKLYSLNNMSEAFDFIIHNKQKVNLSEIKSVDNKVLSKNLKEILKIFKIKKFNVLARNMSTIESKECNLCVSKVFIPGLETMEGDHLCQYLGNTRWQKIPVQLGLKEKQTKLININPYPHPYP